MIIIETKSGREVIFQRNHALVAGALGVELAQQFRPKAWIETIAAVIEHDDAQADFTEETHIDRWGAPLDFRNYGENLLQAERIVYETQFKSKYMMLLVSMHAHALRSPKKVKSTDLKAYLKRQEALQIEIRNHLAISEKEAQEAYLFLRWCDECSLILCENRLEPTPFQIQTGQLPGVDSQYIYQDEKSGMVHMDPWCFQKDSFEVSAEIYTLPDKAPFDSSSALKEALLSKMPTTRTWTFQKV